MSTLVYAPEVTVRILTSGKGHKVVDVSEDIQRGTVTRIINGVSTLDLTLLNQSRKYDGMFTPMDTVVVYLRRIKPMLVFSGYLDRVPMFQSVPGPVTLRASCTLKRLQYFMWDPDSEAAMQLFDSANTDGTFARLADGGAGARTVDLLNKVAGWPLPQIHLGAIPEKWYEIVEETVDQVVNESEALSEASGSGAFMGGHNPTVGGKTIVPGNGAGTGELPASRGKISHFGGPNGGAYGNMALTGESGVHPKDQWYCAMRWPYVTENIKPKPGIDVGNAKRWWANQRILVTNPRTNKSVVLRAVDWGPNISTGRVIDVSPAGLKAIGASTDDVVHISFADNGDKSAPVGPRKNPGLAKAGTPDPSAITSGWGRHGDASNMVTIEHLGIKITVHRLAAPRFKGFLTELTSQLGYRPKSIGGFNDRPIAGTSTWSNHAYGAAIDIDPGINPRYGSAAGGKYALPKPPKIIALARKWGLYWGGEYRNSKDYMHFEVIGAPSTPAVKTSAVQGPTATAKWQPPIKGSYRITTHFGDGGRLWASGKHTGTDFAAPEGTPIFPVGPGTVHLKGFHASYGNWVSIDHGAGVYTFYGHMQDPTTWNVGEQVDRETSIGLVGMTGNTTGPHVHTELRLDTDAYASAVDIEKYLVGGTNRPDPPRGASGAVEASDVDLSGLGEQSSIGNSLLNVFDWYNTAGSEAGDMLTGYRALMNDVPLLSSVGEYMATGLRDFCSAPNGDFIGWFPDYFGHFKQAGKIVIAPIEIDGVSSPPSVYWDDTGLKTHQFVTGSLFGNANDAGTLEQQITTAGIASVEFPKLLQAMLNVSAAEAEKIRDTYLLRYGARPNWEPMNSISGGRQEFFFATHKFMENWSQQYQTSIDLMFMPEAYPGMLACFPVYGIQGYIRQVTHTFDLSDGGGFTTSIDAAPWSSIGSSGPGWLPKGAPL